MFTGNIQAIDLKKKINAQSHDLKKKFEKKRSELLKKYASDVEKLVPKLIPGQGIMEVSIDLRENYKPAFSILGTRELKKLDNGNYFTQFSLFNEEKYNSERFTGNLGFGTRRLTDDKTLLKGVNFFLDMDSKSNTRGSIGGEIKNAVLQLTSNYYKKIHNGTNFEKVLDGYDIQLTSQVPYLHWANVFTNQYKWYGVDRGDVEGRKYGSELFLLPSLNLEFAYDDKSVKGVEDEYYAKIIFVYPPKERRLTALDGISGLMWKKEKDMSSELLVKVKRQNKIMVELSGAATISRLD